MRRWFPVIFIILSGCSMTTLQYNGAKFTRYSFGTQLQFADLSTTTAPNGVGSVTVTGYTSDQVETVKILAGLVEKSMNKAAAAAVVGPAAVVTP